MYTILKLTLNNTPDWKDETRNDLSRSSDGTHNGKGIVCIDDYSMHRGNIILVLNVCLWLCYWSKHFFKWRMFALFLRSSLNCHKEIALTFPKRRCIIASQQSFYIEVYIEHKSYRKMNFLLGAKTSGGINSAQLYTNVIENINFLIRIKSGVYYWINGLSL